MDYVFHQSIVLSPQGSPQRAYNSSGERLSQAKRITNSQNFLTYEQVVRVSHWDNGEFVGRRIYLDHSQVIVRIRSHQFSLPFAAVGQSHFKTPRILDYVIIGENITLAVNDRP